MRKTTHLSDEPKKILVTLALLITSVGLSAQNQANMFDTSFGQEGHVLTSITGGADAFEDVIELSNGKYLAAARFRQSQNSERYIGAIRYMQNGEIDKLLVSMVS